MDLFGVLVVFFFMYGFVGVQLFGGLLYVGNPALTGSFYATSEYYFLNYNDFASSQIALFQVFVQR